MDHPQTRGWVLGSEQRPLGNECAEGVRGNCCLTTAQRGRQSRATQRSTIRVVDPGRPQVARKADGCFELKGFEVLRELAAFVQAPVVWHAEDHQQRCLATQAKAHAGGEAKVVLLRVRQCDEEFLEVVSRPGHLQLCLIHQVLAHQKCIQERRARHRHSVDRAAEDRFGPAWRRNIGQVGVILDRVAADKRRQVGALRLQKRRQAGNVLHWTVVESVREIAAGNCGVQPVTVVGRAIQPLPDSKPHILVDRLPG